MIGWVAVASLTLHFIVLPVITLVLYPTQYESINTGELMTLVTVALGMGVYRTYEKKEGLAE